MPGAVVAVVVAVGLGMRNPWTTLRIRREGCVSLISDAASIGAGVSTGGGGVSRKEQSGAGST